MKKEGDSLIKPSEYLKSLTSRGASLPRFVFHWFVNIQIFSLVCQYTNIFIGLSTYKCFHWFVDIQIQNISLGALLPRFTFCRTVIMILIKWIELYHHSIMFTKYHRTVIELIFGFLHFISILIFSVSKIKQRMIWPQKVIYLIQIY